MNQNIPKYKCGSKSFINYKNYGTCWILSRSWSTLNQCYMYVIVKIGKKGESYFGGEPHFVYESELEELK